MAQQNVTKFGVKHHWGKGNQFCVNESAGPPGAGGVGPNRGNKGMYFKDYSSRTAQQNLTKFGVKHHWEKGNQFCINEGAGPPGARGVETNKGLHKNGSTDCN